MDDIARLRTDYMKGALDDGHADADPIRQFTRWWDEVTQSQLREANAMTLATADRGGVPSARMVLLKGYDDRGFVFFTNYDSRKGRELADNPRAALLFFWSELERQVRIEGPVERDRRGRIGRVLPQPPADEPHRGLGLAAERADPQQGLAAGARRRNGTAPWSESGATAALGRLPGTARDDGVLAGAALATARSAAVYAQRRCLAARATRAVVTCSRQGRPLPTGEWTGFAAALGPCPDGVPEAMIAYSQGWGVG